MWGQSARPRNIRWLPPAERGALLVTPDLGQLRIIFRRKGQGRNPNSLPVTGRSPWRRCRKRFRHRYVTNIYDQVFQLFALAWCFHRLDPL
jgi:hypothetical protein